MNKINASVKFYISSNTNHECGAFSLQEVIRSYPTYQRLNGEKVIVFFSFVNNRIDQVLIVGFDSYILTSYKWMETYFENLDPSYPDYFDRIAGYYISCFYSLLKNNKWNKEDNNCPPREWFSTGSLGESQHQIACWACNDPDDSTSWWSYLMKEYCQKIPPYDDHYDAFKYMIYPMY